MPRFIAGFVDRLHNHTAFNELYEFNVVPPEEEDYDTHAVLPAFVTPELEESHIAEELAKSYGVVRPGDTVNVVLFEAMHDGSIQHFELPLLVQYASKNRGPEYIQIGIDDLEKHFDWARENISREKILTIVRKSDSDRDCIEEDRDDMQTDPIFAE